MRTGSGTGPWLQHGFTYIGLLLFIAISGIGLAAVGQVWHTEAQREREKELLFVGEQYARAIASYHDNTPGGARQYPARLEDLLQDDRFPLVKRHLRKLYLDPMTGNADWGLLKEQGRIVGIYSISEDTPFKRQGFSATWLGFEKAERYSDWRFSMAAGTLVASASADSNESVGGGGALLIAAPQSEEPSSEISGVLDNKSAFGNPKPTSGNESDLARKQLCQSQQVADTAACSFLCREKGSSSGDCRQCQLSIISRKSACLKGGDVPELALGS